MGGETNIDRFLSGELVLVEKSSLKPVVKPAEVPKPDPLWKKVSDTVISVNLDFSPTLPFAGAVVEKHEGRGWFEVEKRVDGLYVGGRKVELYLSNRQLNGKEVKGYELRDEVTKKVVLNANILDALYENPHLIPGNWRKDAYDNTLYIYFWGTIYFRSDVDDLYVRDLCFDGGKWRRYYHWLGRDWNGLNPAALLAS